MSLDTFYSLIAGFVVIITIIGGAYLGTCAYILWRIGGGEVPNYLKHLFWIVIGSTMVVFIALCFRRVFQLIGVL